MNKLISFMRIIFSFILGTKYKELSSTDVALLMIDRKKELSEQKRIREQIIAESKRRREKLQCLQKSR